MRNDTGINVPDLREVFDMCRVVPIAEAGKIAIGAALASVLGGGLAIHLQNT